MKKEVIFTSFDLNEVTLSTAAIRKAAGIETSKEKPDIKIDQVVIQADRQIEELYNALEKAGADEKQQQLVNKIIEKYKNEFTKERLIHFFLDLVSFSATISSLAAATATGGIGLAGLIISSGADLIQAALYMKKGDTKRAIISFISAIPVAGQVFDFIKLLVGNSKIKREFYDFLKSKIFVSLVKRGLINVQSSEKTIIFIEKILGGSQTSQELLQLLKQAKINESLQRKNKRSLPSSTHSRKRVVPKQQLISESQIHRWQVLANIKK